MCKRNFCGRFHDLPCHFRTYERELTDRMVREEARLASRSMRPLLSQLWDRYSKKGSLPKYWDSRQHHEKYLAWRTERGDVQKLMGWFDGEPTASYLDDFEA